MLLNKQVPILQYNTPRAKYVYRDCCFHLVQILGFFLSSGTWLPGLILLVLSLCKFDLEKQLAFLSNDLKKAYKVW